MATSLVVDAFRALVGHSPVGVWSAPGRVNLIGEHTDYNDGFVLPFALPLRTRVAAGPRRDRTLSIHSRQEPGPGVAIPIETLAPGAVTGWAAYVAGVVWSLRAAGHPVAGLDLVIDGAVPSGSGLSSSAALECAVVLAAADLYDLDIKAGQLARHAQHAENDFVGVPCGLMDQMVAMVATAGHAVFFDTRSESVDHIAIDLPAAGLRLLVIDTHTKHAHAGGSYRARRTECVTTAGRLGVPALRDVSESGLEEACRLLGDEPVLCRRLRHVVSENARTERAAALLLAGRVAEVGPLLSASHRSLRDDFEVSSPELDAVVDAACAAGALGARLTGGGFGGSVIALVPSDEATTVTQAVRVAAATRGYATPTLLPAIPSAGAGRDVGPAGP